MNAGSEIIITTEIQQLITPEQAWHYFVIPKATTGERITLFADEVQFKDSMLDELEILLGRRVSIEKTPSPSIQRALGNYYRSSKGTAAERASSQVIKKSDDFLVALISEAKNLGSSDIHIEYYEEKCRVRFRIDGHLIERYTINKNDYPALINKIKIKADLNISEKRLPQDGRILFNHEGLRFDIRVSILPTLHGEKIVLRLLNKDATNIDIKTLGFSERELSDYLEGIKKPHGIILISGPTGSGKTTTLYATLKLLNKEKTNVLTIEDPIEYTLEGINQVQLREDIGLTFARALRTFLRQDPDVIMLGEIRDSETAQMAIRAALTGHLVLSTIHTNSAWGTVSRLVDMGVPSYLIAGTINLSVAQRLVRLLCPECREKRLFDHSQLPHGFAPPRKLEFHYVAKGCDHCHFTGFKGRKAIYEVIPVDHELAEKIKNNIFDISDELRKRNIKTLSENAFEVLEKGETSIEEAYTVLLNSI
jgi:type IV pilus assembly protein PilB